MAEAILGAVAYLLQGAQEFVARTDNQLDDLFVEILGVVFESDAVRAWFESLMNVPHDSLSLSAPPEEVIQAFAARNIPWDKVLPYVVQILGLVRVLLGK